MKKIELYYNKENDCLQYVENGVLKYHDEYINNGEFLNDLGGINSVEDLKNTPTETIVEGYESIIEDFKYFESEEYVKGYFKYVQTQEIKGVLVHKGFSK